MRREDFRLYPESDKRIYFKVFVFGDDDELCRFATRLVKCPRYRASKGALFPGSEWRRGRAYFVAPALDSDKPRGCFGLLLFKIHNVGDRYVVAHELDHAKVVWQMIRHGRSLWKKSKNRFYVSWERVEQQADVSGNLFSQFFDGLNIYEDRRHRVSCVGQLNLDK